MKIANWCRLIMALAWFAATIYYMLGYEELSRITILLMFSLITYFMSEHFLNQLKKERDEVKP